MQPEDNRPKSPLVVPARSQGASLAPVSRDTRAQQDAAADVVRGQIDTIIDNDPYLTTPVAGEASSLPKVSASVVETEVEAPSREPTAPTQTPTNLQASAQASEVTSPYERTHNEQQHQLQLNAWQKYHSAWQSYYQQYYERYYVGQVRDTKRKLEERAHVAPTDESISTNEAMNDLRSKLRAQINTRAQKVRKSRHFMPAMAAIVVMCLFLFLQYNRVMLSYASAYLRPSQLESDSLITDTDNAAVSADPRLIIPKISVDVPIVWDADASSLDSLNKAMDKGVAWFNIQGASARPGENGNFVLSGHSSNEWLDGGQYKSIFAPLERMQVGDTIYVNYNSKRYIYQITGTKVVKPTDVEALHIGTDKPRITLITCTPLGTALNRLLVFADQISPDPATATTAAEAPASSSNATKMPTAQPTFLERIFGVRWQ